MKSDYGKKATSTFENVPQEQWDKIFKPKKKEGNNAGPNKRK